MKVRGKVRDGVVVLDKGCKLPEGQSVSVEPVPEEGQIPTLYERLKDIIGKAKGLPSDMARNHDHYLHGRPKKRSRKSKKR